MTKSRRFAAFMLLLPCLVGAPGCNMLNQLFSNNGPAAQPAKRPTVVATPMALQRSPTLMQLAAYYCPYVITDQIARLGCTVALGSAPPREALVFQFGTGITVQNPNNIPVPALDVLVAMKLFSGSQTEGLAAICVSMCGGNEPGCTGAPKPGACSSSNHDIRNINDFVQRIPGLIEGLVTGQVQNELRKSTIAAGGNIHLNLAFSLGIDQMLRVVQKVAQFYVQELMQRRSTALVIPVSGEGTVFVQLPALGRIGVGFGPLQTSWRIL